MNYGTRYLSLRIYLSTVVYAVYAVSAVVDSFGVQDKNTNTWCVATLYSLGQRAPG